MPEILKVADYFGKLTFNKKEMEERLSKSSFNALMEIIEEGGRLTPGFKCTSHST